MDSLITISVPTEFGIDIYSAKIIPNYPLYIRLIRESNITIDVQYNNSPIMFTNELIDLFIINDSTKTMHFKGLYDDEFNTSPKFKIFDHIESAYIKKCGHSIYDHPEFKKYYELIRKIAITEKSLVVPSIKEKYLSQLTECKVLLFDPIKSETQIIEKLESILKGYKSSISKSHPLPIRERMTIKKNKYGQFVYDKYNFVYDPVGKSVIGVSDGSGGIYSLTEENCKWCEDNGIRVNTKTADFTSSI